MLNGVSFERGRLLKSHFGDFKLWKEEKWSRLIEVVNDFGQNKKENIKTCSCVNLNAMYAHMKDLNVKKRIVL